MQVFNDKTFFVTGGAGFIGTNFIKITADETNSKIIVVDSLTYAGNLGNIKPLIDSGRIEFICADISDYNKMKELIDTYKPDYVINFAAESHVDRSIEDSGVFVKTNITGTHSLLEACKKSWSSGYLDNKLFLQVSTDEVYGSLGDTGVFTENTPLDPHSPYSASKASADLLVKSYVDTYGFPAVITRCSNNYGPYQFPEKLIPLMINNILQGKKLPVYGTGKNVRDWIYVDDHCRGILAALNSRFIGDVFNIGSTNEMKNIDIVKLLIKIVGEIISNYPGVYESVSRTMINEELITFVADRPGHDFRYAMDSSKLQKLTGWCPLVSFEEGIKKTVLWYLDNMGWMKEITSGEYLKYYERNYGCRGELK